jgi:hypothetical protein
MENLKISCSNCNKQFASKQMLQYHLKKAVCKKEEVQGEYGSLFEIVQFLQKEVKELKEQVINLNNEVSKLKEKKSPPKEKKSPPKEKKEEVKKSPPSASQQYDTRRAAESQRDDIKPFSKEQLKNVVLKNIKFGKLYTNYNLSKYYLFYDDAKEYIWSYSMSESYKETQDVFPLTRMTIVMRNTLKKYGFKLLDTDEEFEKRYHNCKDNRSISTLMYEKKQMEEVNVSEDELVDNINCLCNKVVNSEDSSRLDNYGICDVPLYTLYQIKNEYKMWLEKMCEDEKEFENNKEKITKINKLLLLCHYNINDDKYDKYLSNLYTFLDEIDISCEYEDDLDILYS